MIAPSSADLAATVRECLPTHHIGLDCPCFVCRAWSGLHDLVALAEAAIAERDEDVLGATLIRAEARVAELEKALHSIAHSAGGKFELLRTARETARAALRSSAAPKENV